MALFSIFNGKRKKQKKVEEDLIFALQSFATQLDTGLSFEECLGKEHVFGRVIRDVGLGASIPQALRNFAATHDSPFIRKSAALLADIYVRGGNGSSLRKISEEQAAVQRSRMKEYSEKLAMFSLAFIICTAVIPALFQAFVIIGSSFMPLQISPAVALFIPIVGFPLLAVAAFVFIVSQRP